MTSSSTQRLATWLIVAVSVGYPALGLIYLTAGYPVVSAITLAALVAVGIPHYLNMRAALRGTRPPYFPLTIIAQAVATYLPDPFLPSGWSGVTAQLLACTLLLLLPLRVGAPLVILMSVFQAAGIMASGLPVLVIAFIYGLSIALTGFFVYAVMRFLTVTRELENARAELARAAVLEERLRISRDLHDGLGRSLTAIALKGDLAARLMERDPDTAKAEVGDLVKVAREAAQDVRQVARGYREMSLSGETHRAVSLLEASGVGSQVNLTASAPPRTSEEALAWAVREGVTNVLRHSDATTCTITTSLQSSTLRLEIVNDGVPATPGAGVLETGVLGAGLAGLSERAAQAGGTATAEHVGDHGFRLTVEVPA